ncbi:hypothetical protein GH714_014433 [Hevea brasiliensis]|uniref:DDE Tnp4 domain-containing protein n=1 Tax=Hevea brasiliensis TaxID=3981 RepID=A0A6A6MEA6_HEVBR|nr:hypothetical protein GH714_014433 [Hevea brasiliensis]
MSKQTFTSLLSLLSPSLLSFLPSSIPPDSAIAATLFRLAHGASYESVAPRFGLDSPAAACLAFYSVCKTVNEKLGDLVDFGRDLERIVMGFEWISLPNCCGVLGFGKFGVDSELLGKNGSLLVQALVDSEGRFLDISAGWPCTMKPESIFTQTKLYSRVEGSRELLNGACYQLSESNSIPQYILGDSCFPLLPWLLTPFIRPNEEDSFGSAEREFNAAHSRAMGLVGNAFGRVKARWQLLARRWKEDCVEIFPFVIVMGCLLHNFLIKYSEPLPEESVGRILREEELPVFEGEADERGERTRPNEDSFGSAEREFNDAHGRAMGLVGNAFGRVKARWQLLAKRWKEDCVENFPFVIVMGCLLHNFLIKYSEPLPEESVGRILREEELPIFEGEADGRGERTRYALAKHLSWEQLSVILDSALFRFSLRKGTQLRVLVNVREF